MHIRVFLNTKKITPQKQQSLYNIWNSINAHSDYTAELDHNKEYQPCDVGITSGGPKGSWAGYTYQDDEISKNTKCFIAMEGQIIGCNITPERYRRIGIGGTLNRSAIWGEELDRYPSDRFDALCLDEFNIEQREWKKGSKVIIALQTPHDQALRGKNVHDWALDVIKQLRDQGCDRKIEVRSHPWSVDAQSKSKKSVFNFLDKINSGIFKNVSAVRGNEIPWKEHFEDTHCVVAYSSGLSIDAVLYGVPVIACDQANFVWDISTQRLEDVENLYYAPTDKVVQWLYGLAYRQWTEEEIKNGTVWKHFEPTIIKILKGE
jgi:hypothetical protein